VHHTQLLNALVRDGRLTPVAPVGGPGGTGSALPVTYHDPCYRTRGPSCSGYQSGPTAPL